MALREAVSDYVALFHLVAELAHEKDVSVQNDGSSDWTQTGNRSKPQVQLPPWMFRCAIVHGQLSHPAYLPEHP